MGSFLLFILVIFLLIIGLGAIFVFRFVRLLTKGAKTASPFGNTYRDNQQSHNSNESTYTDQQQGKVFSKEEGEYVDYEEIK